MISESADHWLVRGLGGVNIVTLILLILGGAKLYFDLDKEIALIKRDLASIERTLATIRTELRRQPSYSWVPDGHSKSEGY